MSNKAEIPLKLRRRTHLVDRVIKNLLANMYPCYYNSSDHFVTGVLDEIIWFLLDMKELQGINRNDIENYILDYKYDELTDYFNEHCIVLKNDNLQEHIRKVLREETELNKEQFRKIKIVKNFINLSYPHFNKKEIKIERRIMDPLAYEKRFEDIRYEYRDSKTNKYYAIYHEKNNELQLNKEIFKSLKSFLGDEIMEYVIEWFNNEFNKDANSVTF